MSMDQLNGPWSGWWVQRGREGHEGMTLAFSGGGVSGDGSDEDGEFSISGHIYADGSASLTKVYTRPLITTPLSLAYLGHWDGKAIRGTWINESYAASNGPFVMWPGDSDAPSLAEAREQPVAGRASSQQELVPVRSTSWPGLD